jgi:hypothetical protein
MDSWSEGLGEINLHRFTLPLAGLVISSVNVSQRLILVTKDFRLREETNTINS